MKLFKLQKTGLKFSNHPEKLLDGITSNTLNASKNAFLDRFGKIVATFDQIKIGDELFAVISSSYIDHVLQHLKPFMRFTHTKLEKTDLFVYFDIGSLLETSAEDMCIKLKVGNLILTKKELKSTISEEDFTLFRLHNSIPMHGIDYTHEMILNVSEDFVSFDKGCYLGQEIVARVKFKSKPPKKLVVVHEEYAPENAKISSKVKDVKTGKCMGFCFVSNEKK